MSFRGVIKPYSLFSYRPLVIGVTTTTDVSLFNIIYFWEVCSLMLALLFLCYLFKVSNIWLIWYNRLYCERESHKEGYRLFRATPSFEMEFGFSAGAALLQHLNLAVKHNITFCLTCLFLFAYLPFLFSSSFSSFFFPSVIISFLWAFLAYSI